MVPNNEKLLEALIRGLPRSIEGNVTASKPQTLEEAINISQRFYQDLKKFYWLSSRDVVLKISRRVKGGSLKKFKKRSPEELKPWSEDTRRTSGNTTRNDPFPPFLIIEAQTQATSILICKRNHLIHHHIPITSPSILTHLLVYQPSKRIDPRYFFVPEELLPPKKRICSSSSSSTTLSNSSWNQTCDLVSPSSSVYTLTPPQVFEIGKCSDKMYLKYHEKQVEDILNYLDELYLHRIEKMEEGRIDRMIIRRNSDKLKTELKKIRTQIIKLQKKRLGQKDKIAFAYYRISDLEQIIEKIQARH
ncbi:hypothetical protein Tco_1312027 [Tanacetum coccineum]